MTERERREQGLPPSPALLALHESMRKDAEEHMQSVANALQPIFDNMQEPARRIAEMADTVAQAHKSFSAFSPSEPVIMSTAFLRTEPRPVRLVPDQFNELKKLAVPQTPRDPSYMDLVYEHSTKELYRDVYGKRFSSSFEDTEDNKRLLLIERLFKSSRPIQTKKLAAYLECSQKQVQNLVQAVNAKVEGDLHLPQPFIKANRGSGYYVNKFYCICSTN